MITAKIGDTILKLASIKDAETLLNIANNAEHLSNSYDTDFNEYFYPTDGKVRITVEITNGDTVVTHEEHLAKRAVIAEKKRLADAKAASELAIAA